jgi:hypothetical protein
MTGSAAAAKTIDATAKPVNTTSAPSQVRQDSKEIPSTALTNDGRSTLAAVSQRVYWGLKNGEWILSVTGLPVTAGQAVMVSATESDGAGNEQIGAARISIYNVAVANGQVVVFLNIASGSPVNLWLHYLA